MKLASPFSPTNLEFGCPGQAPMMAPTPRSAAAEPVPSVSVIELQNGAAPSGAGGIRFAETRTPIDPENPIRGRFHLGGNASNSLENRELVEAVTYPAEGWSRREIISAHDASAANGGGTNSTEIATIRAPRGGSNMFEDKSAIAPAALPRMELILWRGRSLQSCRRAKTRSAQCTMNNFPVQCYAGRAISSPVRNAESTIWLNRTVVERLEMARAIRFHGDGFRGVHPKRQAEANRVTSLSMFDEQSKRTGIMRARVAGDKSADTEFLKASMADAMSDVLGTRTLEALADYIRHTLPLPSSKHRMELNREARVVVFTLYGQQFVVTPSLEVFELKGTSLLITAASSLFRSVLAKQEKNARLLDTLLESLGTVEDLLGAQCFDKASSLLGSVRRIVSQQHRFRPPRFLDERPACREPSKGDQTHAGHWLGRAARAVSKAEGRACGE